MALVVRSVTTTILNTTAVSSAATTIPLQPNEHIIAIQIPAAWTAADIGVDVSQTDITANYVQVVDSTRASATSFFRFTNIAVSTYVESPRSGLTYPLGTSFVRLHSINTASNADVNQGGDRILTVFIGKDS